MTYAVLRSAAMQQNPFGTTGLTVSVVGFGAGHIGEAGYGDDAAAAVLRAALDAGVTFVDTARGYGLSEQRIGRLLPHRDGVVLSTKVGYDIPGARDWSAAAVAGGVDEALTRLRTDVLDVVFLHSCSRDVLERGEAIEALLGAQRAGKVRVVGYSGENDALEWAVHSGFFGAVQTSVNLADQWSLQHVLCSAAGRGLGVVAKRPLANVAWRFAERPVGAYADLYWQRLRELDLSPADGDWLGTAVRFSAFSPGISTAIVGTGSPAHLAQAVAAAERGPLPAEEYARWRDAFAAVGQDWPGDT